MQTTPRSKIRPCEPKFIQVSNRNGLNYLERHQFEHPVNAYSKKKDATGAHLIRIGFQDKDETSSTFDTYYGPVVIVRCMTGELLGAAEAIVRERLGLPTRFVVEGGNSCNSSR